MAKRRKARFSFDEARKIRGSIVYALSDNEGIFYVGKTTYPKARFWNYAERAKNVALRSRIKAAGKAVRVEILVRNPEDLSLAERNEIARFSGQIVNIADNPEVLISSYTCQTCSKPIRRARDKFCHDCAAQRYRRSPDEHSPMLARRLAHTAHAL